MSIMANLGREYHRAGHSVIVAGIYNPLIPEPKPESRAWGEIIYLGEGLPSWLNGIMVFLQLFKLLKDRDCVHIFLWGDWSPELTAAWLACRLRGVPRGLTFLDRVKPGHGRIVWNHFAAGCQWLTTVSRFLAQDIAGTLAISPRSLKIVPNGFNPEERDSALTSTTSMTRPFVLCLARLRPYKGIDVLLMAWKDVCNQIKDVDLVLCGPDGIDGRYQDLTRHLGISSRVIFMGASDRQTVWSLLDASCCVVLASRREAFGIAVIEAMACGKAVLATRSGGPEELIEGGMTGLLVPPQNVEALRDGLLKLLETPALCRDFGKKARIAASRFQWNTVAGSYLNLLELDPASLAK